VTTAQLIEVLARRWYIVLCGIVGTALLVGLVVSHAGVYWTQVNVVFLAPQTRTSPNAMVGTSKSLIATAGLVEREVNRVVPEHATTSTGVSLIGRGVDDGYLVRLPDRGGQWTYYFDDPVLDVQTTGPDPSAVLERAQTMVAQIDRTLQEMQDRDGVALRYRITTELAPASPAVYYSAGQPKRAIGMALVLGALVTVVSTATLDRVLLARPRRARRRVLRRATSPAA